jgi:hypothetical protein
MRRVIDRWKVHAGQEDAFTPVWSALARVRSAPRARAQSGGIRRSALTSRG